MRVIPEEGTRLHVKGHWYMPGGNSRRYRGISLGKTNTFGLKDGDYVVVYGQFGLADFHVSQCQRI